MVAVAAVKIRTERKQVVAYYGQMVSYVDGEVTKGFGRFVYRMGIGLYEIATHPFATHQGSYRPPYKSNIPWIHGGYEEFPPELGFQSRYRYVRGNYGY